MQSVCFLLSNKGPSIEYDLQVSFNEDIFMNSGDILEEIYVVVHPWFLIVKDSQTLYNLGNILAPFPSYILRENHKDFIPRITSAGLEMSWEEIVQPHIYHPQDLEIFNIAQPAKKVVQDTTMQLSPSHDDNRERSQECAGGAGNEQSNNNSAGAHPNMNTNDRSGTHSSRGTGNTGEGIGGTGNQSSMFPQSGKLKLKVYSVLQVA